jgi:dihydroorotate dehydrogenase
VAKVVAAPVDFLSVTLYTTATMGIKAWLTKKVVASQMKGATPEMQEMITALVEKNPELFQKIASEMEARTKKGEHQMFAMMQVMKKYQKELQGVMGTQPQQKIRPF